MAIQDFTAGQILTAAQMDSLQANDYNQTVSTKTANYTLVAADKGTRVAMNAAGATTITVNDSLFNAGDTLFIQNIGAGTCTITAGAGVTLNTSGSLALAQYGGGQLVAISASSFLFMTSAVSVGNAVSFTPTFNDFTLGNGTATASYVLVNKLCFMTVKVTLGSTSSVTGSPSVNLPFTAASTILFGSNAVINDASPTVRYVGLVYQDLATRIVLMIQDVASTYPTRTSTSSTVPMTWATNDVFNMTHVFEVA